MRNSVSEIKRAQKESVLLRLVSELFSQKSKDDAALRAFAITRTELSQKKGMCYVYFYTTEGKEAFQNALDTLKLYKPSLRKAIATQMQGRYVPDIIFAFDDQYEKVFRIEELLLRVSHEQPVPDNADDSDKE